MKTNTLILQRTFIKLTISLFLLSFTAFSHSQEITDAFEDLKRQGTVNESDSEMRQTASAEAVEKLLAENPATKYFCFTEDRMHDIRMRDAIPARWVERPAGSRTVFSGTCAPGEFYTLQIGLYAPYTAVENVKMTFPDLAGDHGQKIKSQVFRCFNLGGINTNGKPFVKKVDVPQGAVQAFWVGIDVPVECRGTFKGKIKVAPQELPATEISVTLHVEGAPIANHGDDEGWRKTRLRWLDSTVGNGSTPTAPYTPVKVEKQIIDYLGGRVELSHTGLPKQITTRYDQSNQLSATETNHILGGEIIFVIETSSGMERLSPGKLKINHNATGADWTASQKSRNFELTCRGHFEFDGSSEYRLEVKSLADVAVKDIRLEVPYSAGASKYWMGLGNKGGLRKDSLFRWKWDVDHKHQDDIWIGNINAGLNLVFKDENYERPLVNIYYSLGKLKEPVSWGNGGKGGIDIIPGADQSALVKAYSGERTMKKGDVLYYNLNTLVTPVKPLDLNHLAQERFYHSNSDLSVQYIASAKEAGANMINVHHKKDIYPFINYPYFDESLADLKQFISQAHAEHLKVRLYYTTRELTVKIPELWALRSLGSEVIHDGPGKDARTLIHRNGPNEWLNQNLTTNFIPAWYNAFNEGKYKGDMDISVITTPDSRWNNYYLAGLDWMVKNIGLDGVYIDDSALDGKTLQRARRILDADGKRRLVDIHSWNHMNQWAGYANSLHIYLDLLPYVDRIWIGEGFRESNTLDFWMVEMAGIPFGVMSETLDARNIFKGMVYGMLPRLPWSGNPVPMWKLWDDFGMKDARMLGYWDTRCPVKTGNDRLPATVYINDDKALIVVANWTDLPQNGELFIDESLLGFTPSKASLPRIEYTQWGGSFNPKRKYEVMGRSGLIILLEK